MAVVNRNTSIEFIVKPKQDLYLEGTLRKLPRVTKGEAYPCQMQKNQSFSCLFRHYAKHNGLRKEDLIFSFCDELLPDQTPETVHLMPQDEIWVEHRPVQEEDDCKDVTSAEAAFAEHYRRLQRSGRHSDVTFHVGPDKTEIPAHRAILCARSEYFSAMLREDGPVMCESLEGIIRTSHDPRVFRLMLEFIYTNTVLQLEECDGEELIALLVLANEYLLEDLRKLCEKQCAHIISQENIGRLLLLSAGHNASVLRQACAQFVCDNKALLATDPVFRQDIEANPELGLLLFEASLPKKADGDMVMDDGHPGNKRRRVSEFNEAQQDMDLVPPQLGAAAGVQYGIPGTTATIIAAVGSGAALNAGTASNSNA